MESSGEDSTAAARVLPFRAKGVVVDKAMIMAALNVALVIAVVMLVNNMTGRKLETAIAA